MKKTTIVLAFLIFGLSVVACGQDPYSLRITLPDQEARDAAVLIRVSVIEPGTGATCQGLLNFEARPGDSAYTVEDQLVFDYPLDGSLDPMNEVGIGTRLFYGEAEDASGKIILNGCTSIEAGSDGPDQVIIELGWLSCEPTNGGVEICDGIDNDCDDAVDEGDVVDLCPVRDHATAVQCLQANCVYECETGWIDADSNMDTGCECRPTRDGEEWCDGLDNDCDGAVDGPGCIECVNDADCNAPTDCMGGTCTNGSCQVAPFPDDTECDDSDNCTENETCQSGVCLGSAKDCDDSLNCTTDTCEAATGDCANTLQTGYCLIENVCLTDGATQEGNNCLSCDTQLATDQWQVLAAGSSCDDGLWCTGTDTCDEDGLCQHTELPCIDICVSNCDEDGQACIFDIDTTPCDDGFACTENETCDGQGNCIGEPIEAYCGADQECLPGCASDNLGCVDRPNSIAMTCPERAANIEAAVCSVSLNNGEGLEDCLHCEVELLPSILSATDFYHGSTGCTLGDWEQEGGAACQSNSSDWCPFDLGDTPASCCENYHCNAGDQQIEFRYNDCNSGGWRLQQTFDFSSFERVRACYGVSQSPEPFGGSIELLYDPGDDFDGTVVACDSQGSWADDPASYPCVELPGSVTAMEQTRLSFWTQVSGNYDPNNMLAMNGIRVTAYPPECNQEVAVVDTDFASCGHDITGDFDGWNFSQPANCAEEQNKCGTSGGLLLGSVDGLSSPNLSATYELDLRDYVNPGRICFTLFHSAGFPGEYRMDLRSIGGSGAWLVPILDSQLSDMALSDVCREICIDLKTHFTDVMGTHQFGLGINGSTTGGYMLFSKFKIYASEPCDATDVIDISELQEDGSGGHQVLVSSSQGLPRRARVTCTWGNEGLQNSREIEFVPCTSMEELRNMPRGDVNVQLCPTYVSYKGGNSYTFMQSERLGPAALIYGAEPNASVLAGDKIQFKVTSTSEFNGMFQIDSYENLEILSQNNPLDSLIQDLSSGIVPSEDLEEELVRITGATVTEINGSLLTISYGTAVNVLLFASNQPADMCVGATFDFLGPSIDYDGTHELRAYNLEDFSNLDTSACE